jgi:hypothetical protein
MGRKPGRLRHHRHPAIFLIANMSANAITLNFGPALQVTTHAGEADALLVLQTLLYCIDFATFA